MELLCISIENVLFHLSELFTKSFCCLAKEVRITEDALYCKGEKNNSQL